MARPAAVMRPGTRRMVRRTGPGVKRRIWAMSRSKATRSMAEVVELLLEQLGRHAVEEQVDREDDDDEVVEAAEDRDRVRDEVAPDDEVAGRRAEQDLAVGRHALVEHEGRDQPGVVGHAAGDRQEGEQRHASDRPSRRSSCAALALAMLDVSLLGSGRRTSSTRDGESTSERARRRPRP